MDHIEKIELVLKPTLANILEAGKKSGHFLTFSVTFTITGLAIYVVNVCNENSKDITLSFMNLSLPPAYGCLIMILAGAAMLYKSQLMNLYEIYLIQGLLDELPFDAVTEKVIAYSLYPVFRNFTRISELARQGNLVNSVNKKMTSHQSSILSMISAGLVHALNILFSQATPLMLAAIQVGIIYKLDIFLGYENILISFLVACVFTMITFQIILANSIIKSRIGRY